MLRLCLFKADAVSKDDSWALVLCVFRAYLTLMRQLQMTYWLEPAGSHGIWGLDDYQFLPFVWGSAQLVGTQTCFTLRVLNRHIRPPDLQAKERAQQGDRRGLCQGLYVL